MNILFVETSDEISLDSVLFPVHLTMEFYTVDMLLTSVLIIIGIPSPPHSFIPGLKSFFSANLFHRSIPFLHQD